MYIGEPFTWQPAAFEGVSGIMSLCRLQYAHRRYGKCGLQEPQYRDVLARPDQKAYRDLERTRAYPYAVQRAKDQIAADLVKTMQRTGIIAFSVQQRHTGDVEVRGTVLLYPLDGLEVPSC